jgi:trans-aconitate 2-methyltransferase
MKWNPQQYEMFLKEREQPFLDLLKLLEIRAHLRIIDLGCGTGGLTIKLKGLFPQSYVLGIDSSPDMLSKTTPGDSIEFELRDIRDIQSHWDIIISNAALHWLPDHPILISNLFAKLNPKGQLAVQIPHNQHHPMHRIAKEIAYTEPFKPHIAIPQHTVLDIADYAEILYHLGACNILAYEKIYPHILENSDALVEWAKGTSLLPYLSNLSKELKSEFLTQYSKKMAEVFPNSPIFFGFKRIFFYCSKP